MFAIVFSVIFCSSNFYGCNASWSGRGVMLVAEYTLRYTVRVTCSGKYYPGRTSIRVELFDVPLQTTSQQVQTVLQHGGIETIDGREAWVIETTNIYATNVFTGTFIVRVNLTTPPVPSQPPVQVGGMSEYLSPDEYVTLHSEVVSQAEQLATGIGSIPEAVARFVEWIRKNIAYDEEVGREALLTDAQVFDSRAGVCDEFSTLLIAFCRATGIPARRVLGYGLNVADPSQLLYRDVGGYLHSWAEVWVPDYGWLKVDPTWGDIGDARRIATSRKYGEPPLRYKLRNAPPGFAITDVTYSVTLTGFRLLDYVDTPVELSVEELGDMRKVKVENNSTIPLLCNVTVKRLDEETYSWRPDYSRIIFLNPDAYCFLNLSKENSYWVHSVPGGVSLILRVYSVSISGLVFIVDGREYRGSATFRWSEGSSHNVSVPQVIEESEGKRHVFQGWSDGDSSSSRIITARGSGSYHAYFKIQYLLTVNSDYGAVSGSGWYDENSIVVVRLIPPLGLAEFPYVYVFKGWGGDAYGESLEVKVTMDSPKVLIARWEKTLSPVFYAIPVGIIAAAILTLFLRKRTRSNISPT
ncbi:MAG: transglutaminase domain-containing protein [Thermoproteota archaeon]